jgi:hypothetical protein
MAPTGKMTNIAPGKGGIERDLRSLGNHRFFAPSQPDMLRGSLQVSAETTSGADLLEATVRVQANQVGHRLPTGFVDRNLLLVVEALRSDGVSIPSSQGPKIPLIAGEEWAGKSGKVYAKRLTDFEGKTPAPFWRARSDVEDTRLIPGQVDTVRWRFLAAADHFRIRLIYRRFWPETAKTKGWPRDDLVVLDQDISVSH